MARYERRIYFERLIELRTAYAAAGDDDRTVAISIDDAIAEAEAAFATMLAADEAALRGEPAESATTE